MGLFSGNSSIEHAVEEATDGKKTVEDWQEMLEIIDQIEQQPNGAKEALKAIMKRIKHRDPHVGVLALSLLDACVANAKRKFHLEVSSRVFDDEVRGMFKNSQNFNRELLEKFALLIKKWSENEFKSDPALALIPSLWLHLKSTKSSFVPEGALVVGRATAGSAFSASQSSSSTGRSADPAAIQKKEEEDFAKAIALSLEEENKKKRSGSASASLLSSSMASTSLYPTVNTNGGGGSTNQPIYATVKKEPKESRKVRAMYDFEAVEDNELTFKAGEILHVIDDSDPNWWKGSNHRGEGLFPTNFVTSDLNYEAENDFSSSPKKKNSAEVASLTSTDVPVELKPVTIDEALIDQTLNQIHDADPEGERPDPADLLELEDQCTRMWPLIDNELQQADKLQSALEEISTQINDALAMYDNVMKEQAAQMPPMGYPPIVEHSLPPGHYTHGPVGNQYAQPPPPQPGAYQAYQEQYPGYGPPPGTAYGPPPPGPPGMPQHQLPPQQAAFQPYVPNQQQAKLAAAQSGMGQQYQQQQQPVNYPGQPQQQPYVYPQQPQQ
ncbi:Signal transducing adapter molecule 2 [Hypsibius exemplaris]|uniref:Signal transducing adapter molecule 2 n=1 Tax=Hypsibius exemplaris TaxID=2072580 RepID=A0A1W0WVD9_HYPEX|nr:Signal transducing adapter molecule 2 [Hypsibius exemplaris]